MYIIHHHWAHTLDPYILNSQSTPPAMRGTTSNFLVSYPDYGMVAQTEDSKILSLTWHLTTWMRFLFAQKKLLNWEKYQERDLQRSTSHCWPPEDLPSAILDRQTWQWKELFGQLGWTWTWKGKIFGSHTIKQFNKCTKHWMNIHRHPLFLGR